MNKQGNRYKVTINLSEESAVWVAQVSKDLDLPVSRVIDLCIQDERFSMVGVASRSLLKMVKSRRKAMEASAESGRLVLEG